MSESITDPYYVCKVAWDKFSQTYPKARPVHAFWTGFAVALKLCEADPLATSMVQSVAIKLNPRHKEPAKFNRAEYHVRKRDQAIMDQYLIEPETDPRTDSEIAEDNDL